MKNLEQLYIDKLDAVANYDTEARHIEADSLLAEFVLKAGFEKLAKAYNEVTEGVWYA